MDTAQEKTVKNFWIGTIKPAFLSAIPGSDIPATLDIQAGGIDGYGGPGILCIFSGIVDTNDRVFIAYALAHETGHCAVPTICKAIGIPAPQTVNQNDFRKHEVLADLTGMWVLFQCCPGLYSQVISHRNTIAMTLGAADFQHPSGQKRMQIIDDLDKQLRPNGLKRIFTKRKSSHSYMVGMLESILNGQVDLN